MAWPCSGSAVLNSKRCKARKIFVFFKCKILHVIYFWRKTFARKLGYKLFTLIFHLQNCCCFCKKNSLSIYIVYIVKNYYAFCCKIVNKWKRQFKENSFPIILVTGEIAIVLDCQMLFVINGGIVEGCLGLLSTVHIWCIMLITYCTCMCILIL